MASKHRLLGKTNKGLPQPNYPCDFFKTGLLNVETKAETFGEKNPWITHSVRFTQHSRKRTDSNMVLVV